MGTEVAARTPTLAALLLHMLPRERDFLLPAGLCPVSYVCSRMGAERFPMYAGIKCEFNRASGWAQAEGRPGACSMQEGPGPCGLTEYYKLGES